METLSEFLKTKENQQVVLKRIIEVLRGNGSWGKRGLFSLVGAQIGLSSAYVGQVLTGKKPITDQFLEKLAAYFRVSVAWLRGEYEWSYEDEKSRCSQDKTRRIMDNRDKLLESHLIDIFYNTVPQLDRGAFVDEAEEIAFRMLEARNEEDAQKKAGLWQPKKKPDSE